MNNNIYTMKVVPAGQLKIFRRIEISGKSTLDTLSNAILSAYDFSRDHLYFFSMKEKVNPDECYFHPMADCGTSADQVRLDTLKLKAGKELFYLYDFGDEWLFVITVEKIVESNIAQLPQVVDGSGTLEQYPDYEDKGEYYDEDLTIEIVYQAKDVIEQRLGVLPAYLQHIWKRIVLRDLSGADTEIMQGIYDLEKAGLLEFEEDQYHLAIKAYSVEQKPGSLKSLKNLSKRIKVEQIVNTLVQYYGVIETQMLEQMAMGYAVIAKSGNVSLQTAIALLTKWRDWTPVTDQDGVAYLSMFCEGITDKVLKARKQYPTKGYRELLAAGRCRSIFRAGDEMHCNGISGNGISGVGRNGNQRSR